MNRPHLDFALALHRQLPGEGNLPWSPYSVASALGLAAAGARGRTYDELAGALAPGSPPGALAPGGELAGVGRMLRDSAQPREAAAAVANTLWMRAGWHFLAGYQETVRGWPGGQSRTVDFAGDPSGARMKINEDVSFTTRGLIQDLLAEGSVHPDVVAVIVNALYLKVAWLNPFAEAATVTADFHTPSGARPVPTMRQQESFPYAAAGGWRMASLPSAGDVVVDLLLPDGAETPGATIPDGPVPDGTALRALYERLRPTKLELHLPRFRIEVAVSLSACLRRLGVTAAFDMEAADLSGITDTDRIWIEDVVHKAVLRVDEQGFEGAAATAVVMRTVSMDLSTPVPFHVDRPFLLLVRHRHTGAVYFLARVVDP